ncbi:MAG: M18 family aminopeptidase [Bacilli bacterium]|nr:M18 family aminopeptidase [Bacilli bacterium]
MGNLERLMNLLGKSYSQFHAVENIRQELIAAGFKELKESNDFIAYPGAKCFITRNDSSIIAFKIPACPDKQFKITATHTDSPTFKIKPNPLKKCGNIASLNCEPYGGGIYYSFFDKPLTIAGRAFVKNGNRVSSELVYINENLLYIPSVCIHMNRNVNTAFEANPARDTIPMLGQWDDEFSFNDFLAEKLAVDSILSYDLYLATREKPTRVGLSGEFLSSPKLDDLASTYTALFGFLNSENDSSINVYASFDNEEVGSLTKQGAHSDFLKHTLGRIAKALGWDRETKFQALANSVMLSIDNAHANHPNRPELSDPTTDVKLNGGIVIKYNANQSYTSDGLSSSIVKMVCDKNALPYQEFTNRNDLRGGSTLGNISNSEVSITTVDIGLPQLAMHSANEIMGAYDVDDMVELVDGFYSSNITIDGSNITVD